MSNLVGRENVYTCQKCGKYTVTVDVDEGVTPFMIGCRASGREGDCTGHAHSSFYPEGPRPKWLPAASWEWYKLTPAEIRAMPEYARSHYEQGGLNLRRKASVDAVASPPTIDDAPRGYYRDKHGSLRRSFPK